MRWAGFFFPPRAVLSTASAWCGFSMRFGLLFVSLLCRNGWRALDWSLARLLFTSSPSSTLQSADGSERSVKR
ncbi:hypothetical protein B0T26DRAFT_712450 [Lasiosphaeria miniovina]|uniref:Uncharacterized protein n=1 Tax=Lasiosphaeria miniovina TaxID=1954250 RepID=A0AA40DWJ8_9PEZI|nr:uncharacterized protein B0T26DRAFT_712450 [Lasiosphaeria miniovina]KAK0718235.1 hypothetical protein B0T26DRAFT_712450 [Lasiosphaeria miniovina]